MSAREDFLKAYNDPARCLCGGDSPDGACESVEGLVDALLNAFAHELAERQHEKAREYEATQTEDFIAGMQVAADLIDPAKEGT